MPEITTNGTTVSVHRRFEDPGRGGHGREQIFSFHKSDDLQQFIGQLQEALTKLIQAEINRDQELLVELKREAENTQNKLQALEDRIGQLERR